ncbi:MAG TPA: hypothetical protein VFS97_14725 [Nitrososphaeraceae archaeon]|nr:hypothetical protein [Nitrososphaeraceae archaeon]
MFLVSAIHHDFNPCGGGERVSFATMQVKWILILISQHTQSPNVSKSVNAYGKDLVSVIKKARKVKIVPSFNESNNKESNNKAGKDQYDIHINIHPDLFPYYQEYFSKDNAICILHSKTACSNSITKNRC